jgi:hypothetical protein
MKDTSGPAITQAGGWIKLSRTIADHDFWREKPFSAGQAFVDLCLLCPWIDGPGRRRGTIDTNQVHLANKWGWHRNRVSRFLIRLMDAGLIEYVADTNKQTGGTKITILNFDAFSHSGAASNGHQTLKRAASIAASNEASRAASNSIGERGARAASNGASHEASSEATSCDPCTRDAAQLLKKKKYKNKNTTPSPIQPGEGVDDFQLIATSETDKPAGKKPTAGQGQPASINEQPEQPKTNAWSLWVDVHRQRGIADPLDEGPDTAASARLAKHIPDFDELKKLMAAYLADTENFVVNNGHSLRFMPARIGKYRNPVDAEDETTAEAEAAMDKVRGMTRAQWAAKHAPAMKATTTTTGTKPEPEPAAGDNDDDDGQEERIPF